MMTMEMFTNYHISDVFVLINLLTSTIPLLLCIKIINELNTEH